MAKNNVMFGTKRIISLISSIRNSSNKFLLALLNNNGLKGLATSHGDILASLFETSPMSMQELAAKIGKDKSTVTALVDKLIAGDYVIKEKNLVDSRGVIVSLTPKGLELKPTTDKIGDDLLNTAYDGFTETDKQELTRLLLKMKKNFEK